MGDQIQSLKKKYPNQFNSEKFLKRLRKMIEEAVINCADDLNYSSTIAKFEESAFIDVPKEDELIFDKNETMMYECIKNYLLNTEMNLESKITEVIAQRGARKFFKRAVTKRNFVEKIRTSHNDVQTKFSFLRSDDEFWKNLRVVVEEAVKYCADDIKIADQSLPKFQDEPPEIAKVLDYILVNWPLNLYNIGQSRDGRSLLRKYANDPQAVLECALNENEDVDSYRLLLRIYWMVRAQRLFDTNDIQRPYIGHYYTMNKRLHITEDKEIFLSRSAHNFSIRNPPVQPSDLDKILNIHTPFSPRLEEGETDFVVDYKTKGMSSAEYYFEDHIDNFYRILFFFI